MIHDKQSRQGIYSGPVIDGPFEGDWISNDVELVQVMAPVRNAAVYGVHDGRSSYRIEHVYYKWIRSYRAWAWWQHAA